MSTVRQVAKDAIVRALATKATWQGIKVGRALFRLVLGAAGTRECHKDAIRLLEAWVKWSAVAKDTEVPGLLLVDTLRMIHEHGENEPAVVDMSVFMERMKDRDGKAGATESPVSEKAGTEEEIKTGG